MNHTNEHKALTRALDTVDDTWRPLTLGLVVSAIIVPVSVTAGLIARLFDWLTWVQSGWLILFIMLGLWFVLWIVYALRVWGLSMDMLSVKGDVISAARAYAQSLWRLADQDMGRPTIEPHQPKALPDPEIEEPPMKVNSNGKTFMLPRTASQFEQSIPKANPVLVDVLGDGSILIDKRDIVRVVIGIYKNGDPSSARHWSESLSNFRHTDLDGRKTQQAIFAYLVDVGLLVKAPNKTTIPNDDHTIRSALGVLSA